NNRSKQLFGSSNLRRSSNGIGKLCDENGPSTSPRKWVAHHYLSRSNNGLLRLPARILPSAMTKSKAKSVSLAFKFQQRLFVASCSNMAFPLSRNEIRIRG